MDITRFSANFKDSISLDENGQFMFYNEHVKSMAEAQARIAELEAEIESLKCLMDGDTDWEKIARRLEDQVAALTAERDRLREALQKALPRMAHRFECVKVLPSEMWHQNGSVSLDSCVCEIKEAKQALKEG